MFLGSPLSSPSPRACKRECVLVRVCTHALPRSVTERPGPGKVILPFALRHHRWPLHLGLLSKGAPRCQVLACPLCLAFLSSFCSSDLLLRNGSGALQHLPQAQARVPPLTSPLEGKILAISLRTAAQAARIKIHRDASGRFGLPPWEERCQRPAGQNGNAGRLHVPRAHPASWSSADC